MPLRNGGWIASLECAPLHPVLPSFGIGGVVFPEPSGLNALAVGLAGLWVLRGRRLRSTNQKGQGVAVVPSNVLVNRYVLNTSHIIANGEPLQEPLSIFWDNRRALPRYAHAFCEVLVSYIRDVITDQ